MFKERKALANINGEQFIVTQKPVIEGDAAMVALAGTTGLCGGDRDSGGRTYIGIDNISSDFGAWLKKDDEGNVTGVEIAVCGDNELVALEEALLYMVETIADAVSDDDE